MKTPFYITTAIAYTSRKPHIGNTYEVILTDAIARYKKMRDFDVYFLTGTDEHGQKISDLAKDAGIDPQLYVDGIAKEIRDIWDLMDTDYDQFIRTTDEKHKKVVQQIFKQLYDQGDIYKGEYSGLYCIPCESFFTETQLIEGNCPDCGRPVKEMKEEAYFFKMSAYQDRLMKHIEDNPTFIVPESRKKEMINNFLKPGLQDLCVSRTSFKWGIPVEFDPDHVVYVWIDALSNYITAMGYGSDDRRLYDHYWPADVHIIGKDILRFHTIYWPIILMALGEPLPKQVFGHPWLMSGTDKMSKSRGNVLYADELSRDFGVDAIRYYVLSEMPYANDGTISYENIIARFNADLANTLGNLVNRTMAMVNKYFDGVIPAPTQLETIDEELKTRAEETICNYALKMDEYKVADSAEEVFQLLRRSNKYIDETMPWALAKEEKTERLGTVLYHLLEAIRISAILLAPFMPKTSEKIFDQISAEKRSFDSMGGFCGTQPGTKLGTAEALFQRLDEKKKLEEIEQRLEKEEKAAAPKEEAPKEEKAEITIDDFMKVELKVGKVLSSEKVKGADKLLVSQIDLGDGDVRQIVSGIALYYTPEEIIGKEVVVVANLKPVKLRGLLSSGMILCASNEEGLTLVSPAVAIGQGAKVK